VTDTEDPSSLTADVELLRLLMERRTQETEIPNLKEQILALENQIQPLSKMSCSQEKPISNKDDQQPSTSENKSKRGNI
jgi:hypothetical protein